MNSEGSEATPNSTALTLLPLRPATSSTSSSSAQVAAPREENPTYHPSAAAVTACFRPDPEWEAADSAMRPPPSRLFRHIAPAVREKLKKREYVPLWYFTVAARKAYEETQISGRADRLGFKSAGEPLRATDVVGDERLSWAQLSEARVTFLREIVNARWEPELVQSMVDFYYVLDNHPTRVEDDHGEEALLLYHARVRRAWYDGLKTNDGKPTFALGTVNDKLLENMRQEIIRENFEAQIRAVTEEMELQEDTKPTTTQGY